MNEEYKKYIQLLILVVIAAAITAAVLLHARRSRLKKRKKPVKAVKPVDCGNISVFFDSQRNAVFIPYIADLFGEGKATSDVTELKAPYDPDQLGAYIRRALASCRNAKPAGSAELMSRLRARDWKQYSSGKLNLSVYFKPGRGILFNTTVRTPEGAYVFISKGPDACLTADAGDETIGTTALALLNRCR
jgi:hypothetical protein